MSDNRIQQKLYNHVEDSGAEPASSSSVSLETNQSEERTGSHTSDTDAADAVGKDTPPSSRIHSESTPTHRSPHAPQPVLKKSNSPKDVKGKAKALASARHFEEIEDSIAKQSSAMQNDALDAALRVAVGGVPFESRARAQLVGRIADSIRRLSTRIGLTEGELKQVGRTLLEDVKTSEKSDNGVQQPTGGALNVFAPKPLGREAAALNDGKPTHPPAWVMNKYTRVCEDDSVGAENKAEAQTKVPEQPVARPPRAYNEVRKYFGVVLGGYTSLNRAATGPSMNYHLPLDGVSTAKRVSASDNREAEASERSARKRSRTSSSHAEEADKNGEERSEEEDTGSPGKRRRMEDKGADFSMGQPEKDSREEKAAPTANPSCNPSSSSTCRDSAAASSTSASAAPALACTTSAELMSPPSLIPIRPSQPLRAPVSGSSASTSATKRSATHTSDDEEERGPFTASGSGSERAAKKPGLSAEVEAALTPNISYYPNRDIEVLWGPGPTEEDYANPRPVYTRPAGPRKLAQRYIPARDAPLPPPEHLLDPQQQALLRSLPWEQRLEWIRKIQERRQREGLW
ncbi:hypothetical protein K488DRAFT_90087 [Vararia minispora EC-137]|uniref:Uncharacterized protein n=1 Tax=Vararia minispora EC-137 TaxID=1314806 RepID=A0ACB8Q8I5_9AGAM|nr:hypothetical protein K488DRAFT_90087 [Vararia minispora EC-137]